MLVDKERIEKFIQTGDANYIYKNDHLVFNLIWLMENIKI